MMMMMMMTVKSVFFHVFAGRKPSKNIFRPEDLEESECPVKALEWDPLSFDYLLVATTQDGLKLVDVSSESVMMKFQLPSVAIQVFSLTWIRTAPGMFLSGGL